MSMGMYKVILNRGTATYRKGKIDFSRGEGGNNYIYVYDTDGKELGYIWLDTHCSGEFAFCGKSAGSCRGIFRQFIEEEYPKSWAWDDYLFRFPTEGTFEYIMQKVIDHIR